jgi:colanic acid/amylovoran biosynthesis glycosyltransferase
MSDERPAPRVGYVLKMYPRFSETFVVTELLAMERQGADIDIFSLRAPVDGRFHESLAQVRAPVTYLSSPGKPLELWTALAACRRVHPAGVVDHLDDLLALPPGEAHQALVLATLVEERGLTHLHAHFGSVAAAVARVTARIAGITYSVTLHAKDIFHDDVDRTALAERLRDAALAVTVSDFNERYLRHVYGDATRTLVRIYNGIDLEAFPYSRPVVRPRTVVGVGRLVEKKGFDHLLTAIALMRTQGREVRLDLVGGGAEEGTLRARAAALGVTDLVTFHGALTQAEAREVICRAAALAAPCVVGADGNRDGLPTVILESLALGTPVVATPVTGIPEAIVDGRTGLLVPESDPAALADALGSLLDHAELRCSLADAGRRHVQTHFDSRTNGVLLHEAIDRLARQPQAVGV